MEKYKFIILGAGPSGLAFAHTLLANGVTSFIVLEKENRAGGLCRSEVVDGSPLDTGGGHFLDTRIPRVLDFVFRFLPKDQWTLFERKSAIDFGDFSMDYPIESNIWQLPLEKQVQYIKAVAYAGENMGLPTPEKFDDWVYWKLGECIANDYMLPYNRKIWSIDLDLLGTYWLEKLPSVSLKEVLMSCLTRKPYGEVPAHKTFFYPKAHGYGEVWDRMGVALGDKLLRSTPVHSIDFESRVVNNAFSGETIINTIPLHSTHLVNLPEEIRQALSALKYAGIQVDYFGEDLNRADQWIYIPDEHTSYHRILNRKTFVDGGKGYWTETNVKRAADTSSKIAVNDFAYPVNTRDKPRLMEKIAAFMVGRNVYGLGRWGTWEHINSDVAVKLGIELAESFLKK